MSDESDLWELQHEPWKVASKRARYDHIHWSIVNDVPVCKGMGTTTQPKGHEDGLIFQLGRASDGKHYRLKGPFTKEQFAALKANQEGRR